MRFLLAFLLAASTAAAERDLALAEDVDAYLADTGEIDLNAVWRRAPIFESADGRFRIRLRSRLLADFYWATSNDYSGPVTEDGAFLRQARIGVFGRAYENMIYMLEYQFSEGQALPFDVFVGMRNLGAFGQLIFGHQREPFSLDGVTPIPFHTLLERGEPTRAFALARNLGIRLNSYVQDNQLTWWIGVFRATDLTGSAVGEGGYAVTGRITWLPARGPEKFIHLGLSASYRDPPDETARYQARAGPVGIGPAIVDTGPFPADREVRLAWAGALRLRAFTLQAEAFLVHDEGLGTDATFYGWYVMASYWLTGEVPRYSEGGAVWGRVRPRRNLFDGAGGPGAWMLAFRFDQLDLNDDGITGGELQTYTVGLTWMWNANTRVKANLVYGEVEGGPLGDGAILYFVTRLQVDF